MSEIYLSNTKTDIDCKKIKDDDIVKYIPKDVLKYTYLRLGTSQYKKDIIN